MGKRVVDKVRAELRRIGTRRERLAEQERKLARDTRKALRQAKGRVPMDEASELAGISRSTAYDVYLKK